MARYTIVVPTYNMSHYLHCCIDSLKKQTFGDFEVILVDDCSTDDSYSICLETSEKDRRFRVVRQDHNRGLSSTRNLGMRHVSGEYLLFVDPDDYIEPGLLEMVDQALREEKADMITWGMYGNIIHPDGHEDIEEMSLNGQEDRLALNPSRSEWEVFIQKLFFASTCNKVYRLDIIRKRDLIFDTECVDFEDFIFNAAYAACIGSFSIKKKAYYHYRQRKGQTAAVKRAWGKTVPFQVSNKVYRACKALYDSLQANECEYDAIMLYALKAYMTEVEYQYRSLSFRAFISTVSVLPKNTAYREMLKHLNQPALRKLILFLRLFTNLHMGKAQALLLWLLNKKNIG